MYQENTTIIESPNEKFQKNNSRALFCTKDLHGQAVKAGLVKSWFPKSRYHKLRRTRRVGIQGGHKICSAALIEY